MGAPDVLLVLHARPQQLLARVRARHWRSERLIDEAALEMLETLYEAFFADWSASPVVRIDSEEHDVRSAAGLAHVVERIEEVLNR